MTTKEKQKPRKLNQLVGIWAGLPTVIPTIFAVCLMFLRRIALLIFSKKSATTILMPLVVMSIQSEVLHAQSQDLQPPKSGQWIGVSGLESRGMGTSEPFNPILTVTACDGKIGFHIPGALDLKLIWQDGVYYGVGPGPDGAIYHITLTPTTEQRLNFHARVTAEGLTFSWSNDIVLEIEDYGPSAGTGHISVTKTEEMDTLNKVLACEYEYTVVAEDFGVNDATLLSEHIRVLDEAINIMTPSSKGQCSDFSATPELIEISPVAGYTSATGPESNNSQLRLARADAVNTYLASKFTEPMHSVWQEKKAGESVKRARADLGSTEAQCNRAAVFSFKLRSSVPLESRITGRKFRKVTATNNLQPDAPLGDALKEVIGGLAGIAAEEDGWGSEQKAERTHARYPSNYKINVVRIKKAFRQDLNMNSTVKYYSKDISYEWGVAGGNVSVYETIDIGHNSTPETTERSIGRSEFDQSSLLNPANP